MREESPVSPEQYALGLLVEEMGETLCHIGRAIRFGLDTDGQDGVSERGGLNRESGDVLAAIEWATKAGLLDRQLVGERASRKVLKLLNPESRDNLGRRLAPEVQP